MLLLVSRLVKCLGNTRGLQCGRKGVEASLPRFAPLSRSYSQTRRSCGKSADDSGNNTFKWSITCISAEEIESLGRDLAELLDPGDVVLLKGDLGAGKTTLSRGLIRTKYQDEDMVVTSPSYLLDNVYDYAEGKKIHHMDLYRLPNGCDMSVLGMPGIFEDSLCLIEWPERMSGDFFPKEYLTVDLSIKEDESRVINFDTCGSSKWDKLERLFQK